MLQKLKIRAAALKRELSALYYAGQDPRLPPAPKILLIVTLAYALSPIDLIPDFIPVLGYLDDLLIVPALLALTIRLIPPVVMTAARNRAEREPVRLKKNPVFAVVFILIWIIVLGSAAFAVFRISGVSFRR